MGDGCLALVVQLLSCVWLFVTPWTVVCQAPLSMGSLRQEYWRGLPFPWERPYSSNGEIHFLSCPNLWHNTPENFVTHCGNDLMAQHRLALWPNSWCCPRVRHTWPLNFHCNLAPFSLRFPSEFHLHLSFCCEWEHLRLSSHLGLAHCFLEICSFRVLCIFALERSLSKFDFCSHQGYFGGWSKNDALLGLCTF